MSTKKYSVKTRRQVQRLLEWLAQRTEQHQRFHSGEFKLLAHCTEKTNAASLKDWGAIFDALSQKLGMMDVGCCGMVGTYDHEAQNLKTSKHIYDKS